MECRSPPMPYSMDTRLSVFHPKPKPTRGGNIFFDVRTAASVLEDCTSYSYLTKVGDWYLSLVWLRICVRPFATSSTLNPRAYEYPRECYIKLKPPYSFYELIVVVMIRWSSPPFCRMKLAQFSQHCHSDI